MQPPVFPVLLPPKISDLETVFGNVTQSLIALGAFALLIMLFSGGFKYLTSGGDPKATESAKNTLTYAIGGFVLLAGSYLILKIIESYTGVTDITEFKITR